jgi:hypothetical protein
MQIMEINEAPVYLRLDPTVTPTAKDLPVFLYESGTVTHFFCFGHALANIFGLFRAVQPCP